MLFIFGSLLGAEAFSPQFLWHLAVQNIYGGLFFSGSQTAPARCLVKLNLLATALQQTPAATLRAKCQ